MGLFPHYALLKVKLLQNNKKTFKLSEKLYDSILI